MATLQVKLAFPVFVLISINLLLGTYTYFFAVKVRMGCNDSRTNVRNPKQLPALSEEEEDEQQGQTTTAMISLMFEAKTKTEAEIETEAETKATEFGTNPTIEGEDSSAADKKPKGVPTDYPTEKKGT